jgi:hypothetical protein
MVGQVQAEKQHYKQIFMATAKFWQSDSEEKFYRWKTVASSLQILESGHIRTNFKIVLDQYSLIIQTW